MVQLCERLDLPPEVTLDVGLASCLGQEGLYGDGLTGVDVFGTIDFPHSALTDAFGEYERAELDLPGHRTIHSRRLIRVSSSYRRGRERAIEWETEVAGGWLEARGPQVGTWSTVPTRG